MANKFFHHKQIKFDHQLFARKEFISKFGNIFENSPWVAEKAYESELSVAHDTIHGFHSLLIIQFRLASNETKLEVLKAQPDLATILTENELSSTFTVTKQTDAQVNAHTSEELNKFNQLNQSYLSKYGFPFILAIKGLSKSKILQELEVRMKNDSDLEFQIANVNKLKKLL